MNGSSRGYLGEEYTVERLREAGLIILARGYHSRYGEIDIIAEHGKYIAFIEVKMRAQGSLASPREWVDLSKQRRIIKTAALYLEQSGCPLQPRFDVVEVITLNTNTFRVISYNHIENAFDTGGLYEAF